MNPRHYRIIRKRYCELLNFHPVTGGWERPIVMTWDDFRSKTRTLSESWWEWECFDNKIPEANLMIDEIEFYDGKVFFEEPRSESVLKIIQSAKKLTHPILRIAKLSTKSGNQTFVKQYHLPPGNQYDQRITKERSMQAYHSIQSGLGVTLSLKRHRVNWHALVRYSPYVPVRKVMTMKRVKQVIRLCEEGVTLNDSLTSVGMSSRTFWRRTGGINKVLEHSYMPHSEWEISKGEATWKEQ